MSIFLFFLVWEDGIVVEMGVIYNETNFHLVRNMIIMQFCKHFDQEKSKSKQNAKDDDNKYIKMVHHICNLIVIGFFFFFPFMNKISTLPVVEFK